ncbi:hypothetical protein IKF74_00615, partial [Candidatus Saccharibacteria bacterium]|nr:hypothetical protein [Candidatus Saccharibacteria bacterium]
IAEASAATNNASVEANWAGISLTLDPDFGNGSMSDAGHGDVDFGGVTPTSKDTSIGAYGTQKVAKKTIKVTTTGKYYTVYLSTAASATTNDLKLNAEGSNQVIPAITNGTNQATFTSPQAFSRTGWGYAVPGSPITGAGFAPLTTYDDYDGNLAGSTNDNLTKNGTGSAFYNTGTWAAVPLYANAQQIWKASNASGFASGDTFFVYYSVMADTDVMSGTYLNEIVYTALASTASLDSASTNMSRDIEFVTSGTEETLKIDLAATGEALTDSNVKVYLVPHNVFANNSYAVSSLTPSNYSQCSVTNVTTTNVVDGQARAATITCDMPSITTKTSDFTDADIRMAGDNSALPATSSSVTGEYDFWVRVTTMGQDIDYVSHYTSGGKDAPAVAYAGLQSKRNQTNGGKGYITEMQEMSSIICKNTNKWGTGIGIDARVYDYTGSAAIKDVDNPATTVNTAALSAKVGNGTFLLADSRDNKTYLVRHLADDQCWMVQNLDLNLKTVGTLTSDNTNLNTKTSWTPSAKMAAKSGTLEGGQLVADYQFQDEHSFGSSLLWGSVCQEGTGPLANVSPTVACTSISVANNRNAVYARSYNNDSATATSTDEGNGPAYITGTQNIMDATECAKITGGSQASDYCKMGGSVGNASSGSNGLARDTKWQPELITNNGGTLVNGSDTFTMRGSMYFGDYYNWYAATAETGTFAAGTITDDICPKGWRLPVNDSSKDGSWTKLLRTTYGLAGDNYSQTSRVSIGKVMQLPLSIPMTGYYHWTNGALYGRGYNGLFWSSTGSSEAGANRLFFYYSGGFNPQNSVNKVGGFTIRCVAR